MLRLRRGDIWDKFLMEKLQILFVEENLVRNFHRVKGMLDVKCLAPNLAPFGYWA